MDNSIKDLLDELYLTIHDLQSNPHVYSQNVEQLASAIQRIADSLTILNDKLWRKCRFVNQLEEQRAQLDKTLSDVQNVVEKGLQVANEFELVIKLFSSEKFVESIQSIPELHEKYNRLTKKYNDLTSAINELTETLQGVLEKFNNRITTLESNTSVEITQLKNEIVKLKNKEHQTGIILTVTLIVNWLNVLALCLNVENKILSTVIVGITTLVLMGIGYWYWRADES